MKNRIACILIVFCLILAGCTGSTSVSEQTSSAVTPTPASEQSSSVATSAPASTPICYTDVTPHTLRVVIDGTVNDVSGCLIDQEYYFTEDVIQSLLGFADTSSPVSIDGVLNYRLSDTAEMASFSSYEYDSALDAIYIWTSLLSEDAGNDTESEELLQAEQLGLGAASDDVITFSEFLTILDRTVEICDSTKLAAWQETLSKARASSNEMTRCDGFMAVLYAAEALGGEYLTYNADWLTLTMSISESWGMDTDMFPGSTEGVKVGDEFEEPRDAVCYFYAVGRQSLTTGKLLFDYDEEQDTMHPYDPLTVRDALLAAVRLYDSSTDYVSLSDEGATDYDKSIITDELLQKANDLPAATADEHPHWTGFVYGSGRLNDLFSAFNEYDIRNMANWGFNYVRLIIDYRDIFNDDASEVNLRALQRLDRVISYGVEYNVHINILFESLPGWWQEMQEDYTYVGSLDIFANPEHQQQTRDIWQLIAKRYRDIPSSALSFLPMNDVKNSTKSSGMDIIQEAEYSSKDIDDFLLSLVDTIQSESPDRLINFEGDSAWDSTYDSSEKAALRKGALINADYGAYLFTLWSWNESDTSDRTYSYFKPDWPTTLYYTQTEITGGNYWKESERNAPLTFDGELPAGTTVEFYVSEVQGNGSFVATADGKEIFRLDLDPQIGQDGCVSESDGIYYYETDPAFSCVAPYAKSEKLISFTLPETAGNLELSFEGNHAGLVVWSQINITLPDSYAVDRWWVESSYDAYRNGTEAGTFLRKTSTVLIIPNSTYEGDCQRHDIIITIHPDITFTTAMIKEKADKQTLTDWVDARLTLYDSTQLFLNIGSADFNGAVGDLAAAYYDDLLSVLEEKNISWLSSDFYDIASNLGSTYAGDELVEYDNYAGLDVKMLKVLQKYQ